MSYGGAAGQTRRRAEVGSIRPNVRPAPVPGSLCGWFRPCGGDSGVVPVYRRRAARASDLSAVDRGV